MRAGEASDALGVALAHEAVAADQRVAGEPATGWHELGTLTAGGSGAWELGVWEMTPGAMGDVEADEVFVVIAGRGTVEFADGREPLELAAGSVVRLEAGMRTVWTVHETLRKVYLTPA